MSNLTPNKKIFVRTVLLIILAELLSFLGYYYPAINFLTFFAIIILVISASLYRLEYGSYLTLTELFIGSFGYLFYYEASGAKISIRLALWLIIISVWLAKTIALWIKTKKLSMVFFKSKYFAYLIILSIFIIWGLTNGLLNGNSLSNLFFDFNNWLYWLLIFPIFSVLPDDKNIKIIKQIFLAAITWLSLKTIMLAYFFSHNFNGFTIDLYRWVRESGVGEITQLQIGFSRIFMQSHLFVLIGFFIVSLYLLKLIIYGANQADNKAKTAPDPSKKIIIAHVCFLSLFLTAIIISFSRSFWVGLVAGGIFVWLVAIFKFKIKFKRFIVFNLIILLSIFFSLVLFAATIRFPFPGTYGGFNPAELLSQRATQLTSEAGVASRWQLLPVLWQKISASPVLGYGFGSTITYRTSDPRILTANPPGLYTTYAFEWGWLDVWLKLGLFGLLAYLSLFIKIIYDGLKINSYFSWSLVAGLVVLIAVNMFSPYINHPLGIGYLIITFCLINFLNTAKIKKPYV